MSTQQQFSTKKPLQHAFDAFGLINCEKITDTLQGSIWRSFQFKTKKKVVIKITNRQLHETSSTIVNGERYIVPENIMQEKQILKYISSDENAPKSLVEYIGFFKSKKNYYLIMENGGMSLFNFVVKAHSIISAGSMSIKDWHQVVKMIFKQIIEAVEYIHSKRICHMDISLENMLINDVDVDVNENGTIRIRPEDVQCKLCDFGLAESFPDESTFKCKKFCGKQYYKSPELNKKQTFNAKKNDIFCIGVCLFMLLTGGAPWESAKDCDKNYVKMMKQNGIRNSLKDWNKLHYVNDSSIELLEMMFKPENERANLNDIKRCSFLAN